MKVLLHYDAGARLRDLMDRRAAQEGFEIVYVPEGDDQLLAEYLPSCNVIWHVLQPLTDHWLVQAPNLKLVQKIGVGVNTIDCEYARKNGIAVCNMPGTNSNAVAELTLMLMLAALRRVPRLDRLVRQGDWFPDQETKESMGEIKGKRIGLIGFGGSAAVLAPILRAMGAEVNYTATSDKKNGYPFLDLDSLLEESDIVSLHCPLTPDTHHLLSERRLGLMPKSSILINTARGGLVDQAALVTALKNGHIAAAGLDVFELEPAPPDCALAQFDQVVVTPHVAWLTWETWLRSIDIAVHNVRALDAPELMLHRVV
jgi:phosphoglycerate dehydrogenase-like enzyme